MYAFAASVEHLARGSAYCFTNFGMRPVVRPAQSVQTSSWPSVCGPAPTLMVGIFSSAVTRFGDLGGHHLEHDGERAGVLDRVRVGEQLARRARRGPG